MTDLDTELSARLSRLAAAVPVARGELDPVHVKAVVTRQRVRIAWVTPLVAIVAAVLLSSALGIGPFAPGATPDLATDTPTPIAIAPTPDPTAITAGPVTASTVEGDFELVLRASKARYAPGEPIEIDATLGYTPDGPIDIAHALGAGRGPLGFGIEEPVLGDLRLGPGWDLACARTTLRGGVPISQPFQKSGGWSSDHPRADEYRQFMAEPVLQLPPGTWHVFAVAEFSIGECSADPITIRTDIVIEVGAGVPSTAPGQTEPRPTSSPENTGLANSASSDSGLYRIEIRSDHRIYRESDPIEIVGTFTYLGDVAIDVQGLRPLVFSVAEPVHGITLDGAVTLECNHDRLLPGQQLEAPFHKSGGVSTLDPEYEAKKAYLTDPVFRLPPGSWHIRVSGWASMGECGSPVDRFTTEIEITVLPDDPH